MTETETKETPGWIQRLKSLWIGYLEVGTVLGTFGAIGFWVWFMTLWGLWGLFLGGIPAGLLGLLILRFIWLPVLLAGLFLLLQLLPSKVAVLVINGIFMAILLSYATPHYEKKIKERTDDKN